MPNNTKEIKVCCCPNMPGLHRAGFDACESEEIMEFTEVDNEIQNNDCNHEDVFDQVCAHCGKVFPE